MSSYFNPAAKFASSPSWCKPGIWPPPGPLVEGWPLFLAAYATWVDHDPGNYAHVSESFLLKLISTDGWYRGFSPGLNVTNENFPNQIFPLLELGTRPSGKPNCWDVHLYIYRAPEQMEDYHWYHVLEAAWCPIKIHPPDDIHIPGEDYRKVYIYAPPQPPPEAPW